MVSKNIIALCVWMMLSSLPMEAASALSVRLARVSNVSDIRAVLEEAEEGSKAQKGRTAAERAAYKKVVVAAKAKLEQLNRLAQQAAEAADRKSRQLAELESKHKEEDAKAAAAAAVGGAVDVDAKIKAEAYKSAAAKAKAGGTDPHEEAFNALVAEYRKAYDALSLDKAAREAELTRAEAEKIAADNVARDMQRQLDEVVVALDDAGAPPAGDVSARLASLKTGFEAQLLAAVASGGADPALRAEITRQAQEIQSLKKAAKKVTKQKTAAKAKLAAANIPALERALADAQQSLAVAEQGKRAAERALAAAGIPALRQSIADAQAAQLAAEEARARATRELAQAQAAMATRGGDAARLATAQQAQQIAEDAARAAREALLTAQRDAQRSQDDLNRQITALRDQLAAAPRAPKPAANAAEIADLRRQLAVAQAQKQAEADVAEQAFIALRNQIDQLRTEHAAGAQAFAALQQEKNQLQRQLTAAQRQPMPAPAGGDAVLVRQLRDAQSRIADLEEQLRVRPVPAPMGAGDGRPAAVPPAGSAVDIEKMIDEVVAVFMAAVKGTEDSKGLDDADDQEGFKDAIKTALKKDADEASTKQNFSLILGRFGPNLGARKKAFLLALEPAINALIESYEQAKIAAAAAPAAGGIGGDAGGADVAELLKAKTRVAQLEALLLEKEIQLPKEVPSAPVGIDPVLWSKAAAKMDAQLLAYAWLADEGHKKFLTALSRGASPVQVKQEMERNGYVLPVMGDGAAPAWGGRKPAEKPAARPGSPKGPGIDLAAELARKLAERTKGVRAPVEEENADPDADSDWDPDA